MSVLRLLGLIVAAVLLAALAVTSPRAAADGWRAVFLLLSAPPLGAVALLLIARLVGANWDAALQPLLPFVPWLALLLIPVIVGQALFHHPVAHLHVWLSWPFFLVRSAIAMLFWIWAARGLARGGPAKPGLWLLGYAILVSVMAFDWILGAAPAQPNSAIGMTLAANQLGGACAVACLLGLGTATQRRDLSFLLIATVLGTAYLLYMDFTIVWFGNLPAHVGWYASRYGVPAALLPGAALALGLFATILLIALRRDAAGRAWAGATALIGLALISDWLVAGDDGWPALAAMLLGAIVLLLAVERRPRHERA